MLIVGFGPDRRPGHRPPPTRSPPTAGRSGVINARFAKPLDRELILDAGPGRAAGGDARGERRRPAASARPCSRLLEEARLADPALRDVALRIVGIPGDRFVDHGSVSDLRRLVRLDAPGIEAQIRETLAALGLSAAPVAPGVALGEA